MFFVQLFTCERRLAKKIAYWLLRHSVAARVTTAGVDSVWSEVLKYWHHIQNYVSRRICTWASQSMCLLCKFCFLGLFICHPSAFIICLYLSGGSRCLCLNAFWVEWYLSSAISSVSAATLGGCVRASLARASMVCTTMPGLCWASNSSVGESFRLQPALLSPYLEGGLLIEPL